MNALIVIEWILCAAVACLSAAGNIEGTLIVLGIMLLIWAGAFLHIKRK